MQRRTLLRRSAALGAVALAGCLGSGDDGDTPTPGGNGDGAGDDDEDTPTPTPSGVADASVETVDTSCASGDADDAMVGFQSDDGRVTVAGTLQTPTPCHVATLAEVTYDEESTVLEMTVVAEADGSETCTQCLGTLEYGAYVDFHGELPGTVTVTHGTGEDAERITRVSRDGN